MNGPGLTKEQLDGLRGFTAANSLDDTNFTIVLGIHRWKVQASVMSKALEYFDRICNGGFMESETRVVELRDYPNPCDFARLLQFVYTNEFDREPGDSNASKSMPLDTVVTKEELSREGWGTAGAREKLEINKAVLALARYYMVDSLRESIATHLVLNLPSGGTYFFADRDFARFQTEFVKVFQVIDEDLSELPKVKEYLVDEIFSFWVKEYDVANKKIPSLLDTGNSTSVDVGLRNFQAQLETFMEGNASFATEMARRSLRYQQQGFENFKWSVSRLDRLYQPRHRQAGVDQLN